jgi:hypothetical protein
MFIRLIKVLRLTLAALLGLIALQTMASVLPEDRADLLYHVYNGDGLTVQGPALLVRKKFGESFAANATLDKDAVTGASIDVRTSGASPLKEHRTQWSGGGSYLRGKTTYNLNYMNSKETDYVSDNATVTISEDTFGDLTTITLGYTRGWDKVSKNTNSAAGVVPMGDAQRRSYRLGLSQILTKKFVATLNFESDALEGYLQNPYRSVRYGNSNSVSISSQPEVYPRTRSSNAISLEGRYYLPWRASLTGSYRYYTDSWGIVGHTGEFGYIHPLGSKWTIEAGLRYYTQSSADFYSDLFPFVDAQNFLARDKILASFNDWSVRLGGSWRWIQNAKLYGVVSLYVDHIQYNYLDFRNAGVGGAPNTQPLFGFGANVFMLQYTQHY